jgi:hypothetical protein
VDRAAGSSKELRTAAKSIGENNKRIFALLTMNDALEQRAYKEATGKGLLQRIANKAATPAGTGAAIGAATAIESGDIDTIAKRAAMGAGVAVAGRAIPAGANLLNRGITGIAIKAAQGGAPGNATRIAGNAAQAAGRFGAGIAARIGGPGDDQEKKKKAKGE